MKDFQPYHHNEKMFKTAVPLYQESRSGYKSTLKFDPKAIDPSTKKKSRKKPKLPYFNPPYNNTATTNAGKGFLALLNKCFP